jgi:hypothetical protein
VLIGTGGACAGEVGVQPLVLVVRCVDVIVVDVGQVVEGDGRG